MCIHIRSLGVLFVCIHTQLIQLEKKCGCKGCVEFRISKQLTRTKFLNQNITTALSGLITKHHYPHHHSVKTKQLTSIHRWLTPDSKFYGANVGPIWGRQDPGGPQVGPMNLVIWDFSLSVKFKQNNKPILWVKFFPRCHRENVGFICSDLNAVTLLCVYFEYVRHKMVLSITCVENDEHKKLFNTTFSGKFRNVT